jgi:SAM-dependent methyltransferase
MRCGELDPATYDAWFDQPWGAHAFVVERDALLDALGPLDCRRLLDVGCGTGRFTAVFEVAGAQVVGIDRDPRMLALAEQRTRSAGLLVADAQRLPLDDDSFDVAVAATLLEFASDPMGVLDELARVVRPGGCIVVAALNPTSPWGLVRRRRLRRPPWDQACLYTPAELRDLLAQRGALTLHPALYAPGAIPGLRTLGGTLERLRHLAPRLGAYQVAVIDLPPPARGRHRGSNAPRTP